MIIVLVIFWHISTLGVWYRRWDSFTKPTAPFFKHRLGLSHHSHRRAWQFTLGTWLSWTTPRTRSWLALFPHRILFAVVLHLRHCFLAKLSSKVLLGVEHVADRVGSLPGGSQTFVRVEVVGVTTRVCIEIVKVVHVRRLLFMELTINCVKTGPKTRKPCRSKANRFRCRCHRAHLLPDALRSFVAEH